MSGGPGGCLVVVSESVGDDRGGHVENVLMDRGDAAWDGGNAERPDQGAKGFRVHRLTRAAAREQPSGFPVGGGVHVGPLVDPAVQQFGDWAGNRGWWFAQTQQNLVTVADHVVGGEADDAAEWLGVEQHDRGRDSRTQRVMVLGQDAADQVGPARAAAAGSLAESPQWGAGSGG